MTIIGLQAWCDYVTDDEYRDHLVRSSAGAAPPAADAPVGPGVMGPDGIDDALAHHAREALFRVQEYVVLADGRRLPLGDERGFGLSPAGGDTEVDLWPSLTLERLEADVRTTVLPDEDTGEEHPWRWLADQVRSHGLDTSPEQLSHLPYDVVFSERLRTRVAGHGNG